MPTTAELLDGAISHQQAGRLEEAVRLYNEILKSDPHHADARHLYGLALHQLGQDAPALGHIARALTFQPKSATFWDNLGAVLHAAKRYREAIDAFQQVLRLTPESARSYFNLGAAYQALEEWDLAVENYERAVQIQPDYVEAHNNLGGALHKLGRREEAIASYNRALAIKADCVQASRNLGAALEAGADSQEAVTCVNLGYAFDAVGDPDLAVKYYRRAIQIRPEYAEAYNNMGNSHKNVGRWEEAVRCYQRALAISPDFAPAHGNMGAVYCEQGQLGDAIASLRRAVELDPAFADAHMNLGLALLLGGQNEEGWREYEWRLKSQGDRFASLYESRWKFQGERFAPQSASQPYWDGTPLRGRTILLHAEQGLGDTIHFVRYAALLKEQAATVLVRSQGPLVALLKRCPGVDFVSAQLDDLPPFDVYAPLMSLPRILGVYATTIPDLVPYLSAPDDLVRKWREEMSSWAGYKIGVCWRGGTGYRNDHMRSFALAELAPLAQVPGVRLISLQKGNGADEVAAAPFPVTSLGPGVDREAGPFMDTAAVMTNLDLVVTCDTAVGHLAGALGVPVWLALARVPDSRWLLDGDRTPWYPTARLFRQTQAGRWDSVFLAMRDALRQQLARTRPVDLPAGPAAGRNAPAVRAEISPGELIDKITILEIKKERIGDPVKLHNVTTELEELVSIRDRELAGSDELSSLTAELKAVNERLWRIEDEIRDCERRKDFGPTFVELARAVYRQNDSRAALKRRINDLLGSRLTEEKSYPDYLAQAPEVPRTGPHQPEPLGESASLSRSPPEPG